MSRPILTLACSLLSLPCSVLLAGPVTYDFSGAFPGKLTLEDRDGVAIQQSLYRNLDANAGAWIAKNFGSRGKVALSPSATSSKEDSEAVAQCNRMVSEPVVVETPGAVTRWDARSLTRSLGETYRVAVLCDGTETEIYRCEGENYEWTTREASLAAYAGKTVQVVIECTSRNKWMLAVDDWSIDVPPMAAAANEEKRAQNDVVVVDHFTGTWCNNCPAFNVKAEQLERDGNGSVLLLETHVNDLLACADYYTPFNEYVRSIPAWVAQRDAASMTDDDLFQQLVAADPTGVEITDCRLGDDGALRMRVDHNGCKIGLVELYDFHDDQDYGFAQSNSSSNAKAEQWYYLPNTILARYMTFVNVPTAWRESDGNVEWRFTAPQYGANPRLLVELLDPADGTVKAATLVDPGQLTAINNLESDAGTCAPAYYDLTGRRVARPAAGIFVKVQGGKATKIALP